MIETDYDLVDGGVSIYGASKLVIDGSKIEQIGSYAFSSSELTSVVIEYGVTTIEIGEFSSSSLENITIPSSVKDIYSDAFDGCSSLTSITIPDSVAAIRGGIFRGSGLESITIPSSVVYIDVEAFASCSNLTTINYKG